MIQNWLQFFKVSNDKDALYHKEIQNCVFTCISIFPKRKRCALILERIKDAPNQSTLKEKQWRGYIDTYKYFGLVADSILNWKDNINSVLKK